MKEYKRLTEKLTILGKTGNILNCANCDKKAQCENVKNYRDICLRTAIERLAELEDKIENGTLIELPCRVGDTVWYIKSYGFGRYQVEDMVVAGFNFSRFEDAIWVVGLYEEQSSHIYKTKAEAEAKLRELQGDK